MGCRCSIPSNGSQKIHKQCYDVLVLNQGNNQCSICKETMNETCIHSGRPIIYKEIDSKLIAKYTINDDGRKEGMYYEIYRDTGDMRKMMKFSGGQAHGEMSVWRPDGSIHLQGHWARGLRHGEWMENEEDPMMGYTITIYFQDALIEYYKYNTCQEMVDYEYYGDPHLNALAKELASEMHGELCTHA